MHGYKAADDLAAVKYWVAVGDALRATALATANTIPFCDDGLTSSKLVRASNFPLLLTVLVGYGFPHLHLRC